MYLMYTKTYPGSPPPFLSSFLPHYCHCSLALPRRRATPGGQNGLRNRRLRTRILDENGGAGGGVFDRSFLDEKKGNGGAFKADFDNVVEISDDSDEDSRNDKTGKGEIEKHDGVGLEQGRIKKVVQGTARIGELGTLMHGSRRIEIMHNGKRVIRSVKSVARNMKKMMGTGKKYRRIDARENLRMEEEYVNVELGYGPSGCGGESGTVTGSNYGHESLKVKLVSKNAD